jgi:nitrate reductase gamma subunit
MVGTGSKSHGLIPIRCFAIAGLAVLLVFATRARAEASWLIDAERFHVSVHGQTSCIECHEATAKQHPHPDPAQVDKALSGFFRIDQCVSCHGEVVARIDEGSHGGKPVKEPQEYKVCVKCHDPHYQLSSTNPPPGFDPGKAVGEQCGACHVMRPGLPTLSAGDEKCVTCHRSVATSSADGVRKVGAFCMSCHGVDRKGEEVPASAFPRIEVQAYEASTHHLLACLACHPKSAEFGHVRRERTACLSCHPRHDEKVAHDAHLGVSCEACHLSGLIPVKEPQAVAITWQMDRKPGQPSTVHAMTLTDDQRSCAQCHYRGNTLGASAMVLPAKSMLCMPCHAATFSVGDTTTILSLLVFLLGMGSLGVVWFSGWRPTAGETTLEAAAGHGGSRMPGIAFLPALFSLFQVLALDVFLQRRLFRQSRTRWFIHGLIFFPFLFRFLWGMSALLTSLWMPESPLPWKLLDQNDPLGAFLFDLSGLLILLGVVLVVGRRAMELSAAVTGLPKPDWLALGLLGGIVVIGFILEGMRIAMTGAPPGSPYAFLGYAISRLFADTSTVANLYGYVWYLHAITTGALVAYLPFSNLLHIIVAPVVLAMNAVTRRGEKHVQG